MILDERRPEEVARETGYSLEYVRKIARQAGRSVRRLGQERMATAVAAVAAGASLGQASADHDVSYGHLVAALKVRGVHASRAFRGRDGSGKAGAELVLREKISVAAAARRVRCSPNSVKAALRKLARASETDAKDPVRDRVDEHLAVDNDGNGVAK